MYRYVCIYIVSYHNLTCSVMVVTQLFTEYFIEEQPQRVIDNCLSIGLS